MRATALQIHTGLQHLVIYASQPHGHPLGDVSVAERLRDVGYRTAMVGKWHLGFFQSEYTPTYRGFDTFYGKATKIFFSRDVFRRTANSVFGRTSRLSCGSSQLLTSPAPHPPSHALLPSCRDVQRRRGPLLARGDVAHHRGSLWCRLARERRDESDGPVRPGPVLLHHRFHRQSDRDRRGARCDTGDAAIGTLSCCEFCPVVCGFF